MKRSPPENFDIAEFYRGIYTFQCWELFPGLSTNGPKSVVDHMDRLKVPATLEGLRVLDIAPWNGFFSFECVRRGAAEVVSLGPDDPDKTGYNKTKALLEIDNCRYVQASVYDLSPEIHGTFDIVLFLGLIYHLRHPLLALDRIYDVAKDRLFADSPIIDSKLYDQTVTREQSIQILNQGKILHELLPLIYYTKGSETGDAFNWFMPNKRAFKDFVESSGFNIDELSNDGGWAWISASKGKRSFTLGVEGWNEHASKAPEPPRRRADENFISQKEIESLRKSLPHDKFISALDLNLSIREIRSVEHPDFQRTVEIANTSTGFNTNGQVWTQEKCEAHFGQGGSLFALRVKARSSDFGITGSVFVLENRIEQLALNSAIIAFDIEHAFVYAFEERLRIKGFSEIKANLLETKHNHACRNFYSTFGFIKRGDLWIKNL